MKNSVSLEIIVQKAIAYMEANLSSQIGISQTADFLQYSRNHLSRAFRKMVGKGPMECLLDLRMDKAKKLLRDTDFMISEITFNCGFSDAAYFCKVFHKRVGLSPTDFRRKARKTGQSPVTDKKSETPLQNQEWFRDNFAGPIIREWWKILDGNPRQKNHSLVFRGNEATSLGFDKSLPENFQISFSFRYIWEKGVNPESLQLMLTNETFNSIFCFFTIGSWGNSMGSMGYVIGKPISGVSWNLLAVFKPEQWQEVLLEFREDTVKLSLDNEEMFRFRDPFPPAYSRRCKIIIFNWLSSFQIRNFSVIDLGSTQLVRTIRQGDMLFNEGLYSRACDFYSRHLLSQSSPTDTNELHYKIGMCFLRQEMYAEAMASIDKVAELGESNFWSQKAKTAALEIIWKSKGLEAFRQDATVLWARPEFRDGIREIIERLDREYLGSGFLQTYCITMEMIAGMETRQTLLGNIALHSMADLLYASGQLERARRIAEQVTQWPPIPKPLLFLSLNLLSEIFTFQGERQKAQQHLDQLDRLELLDHDRFRSRLTKAAFFRSLSDFPSAISLLDQAVAQWPGQTGICCFALSQKLLMQCSLGNLRDARETWEAIGKLDASYSATPRSQGWLVLWLEGNPAKAADFLAKSARQSNHPSWPQAQLAVKAGILYELAEQINLANEIWSETLRRFPARRICYFSDLAGALLRGEPDPVERMPFSVIERSEMFYLVSLLCEKRGHAARARELLELCVKEDPTNRWPAMLARKKMGCLS